MCKPMQERVTAIVVNYNTSTLLDGCLRSLTNSQTRSPLRICVVDNGSRDESVTLVKRDFPNVRLIENAKNLGYAKANNLVLKDLETEFALLVNSDVRFPTDAVEGLVAFMDSHQDACAVGPKLVRPDGTFDPGSKMGFATVENVIAKRIGLERGFYATLSENETGIVDAVAGASMMIRKTALDRVGLFDESFFLGCEDLDLAYRMKSVYYYPEVKVIHLGRQTRKRFPIRSITEFHRSSWRLYQKYQAERHSILFNEIVRAGLIATGVLRVATAVTMLPLRKRRL